MSLSCRPSSARKKEKKKKKFCVKKKKKKLRPAVDVKPTLFFPSAPPLPMQAMQ